MAMHPPPSRAMGAGHLALNECKDGTICENSAPCTPHPVKEGSYMCGCNLAHSEIMFAGVYCEHQATSYCESGSDYSDHAFCTNGGTCKRSVAASVEHAGCKCPSGYEGDYCQFVEGGRPSDWLVSNYQHPYLVTRARKPSEEPIVIMAVMIAALTCFLCLCIFAVLYVYLPSLKNRMDARKNEKEMDTGGNEAQGSSFGSFVGGMSVYKKKNSTTSFVTPDTLDADGGVLTEALGRQAGRATMKEDIQGLEGDYVDVDKPTSLEEVNLDDEPSSKLGEMA